jgi:hypothetical protein
MDRRLNGEASDSPVLHGRSRGVAANKARRRGLTNPRVSSQGPRLSEQSPFYGIVIGRLVGFGESGFLLVDHSNNTSGLPLQARSTVRLGKEQVGREITLMFEAGDPQKPVVTGVVEQHVQACDGRVSISKEPAEKTVAVELEGTRLVFAAESEIVLRCGEASITLTRAGKVLIRGTYLLSRSSGAHRIKGASVEIN